MLRDSHHSCTKLHIAFVTIKSTCSLACSSRLSGLIGGRFERKNKQTKKCPYAWELKLSLTMAWSYNIFYWTSNCTANERINTMKTCIILFIISCLRTHDPIKSSNWKWQTISSLNFSNLSFRLRVCLWSISEWWSAWIPNFGETIEFSFPFLFKFRIVDDVDRPVRCCRLATVDVGIQVSGS